MSEESALSERTKSRYLGGKKGIEKEPDPTLMVDRFSSTCANCMKDADPSEKGHFTLLGYGPDNGQPGCGIIWTQLLSLYYDESVEEDMKRFRPDLKYVGLFTPWTAPEVIRDR